MTQMTQTITRSTRNQMLIAGLLLTKPGWLNCATEFRLTKHRITRIIIMDKLLGKKKGDKGACATLPVLSTGTSAVSRTTAGASSSSSNHPPKIDQPTQKRARADSQDDVSNPEKKLDGRTTPEVSIKDEDSDGELGNLTDDEITKCIDKVSLNADVTTYSEAAKNPG